MSYETSAPAIRLEDIASLGNLENSRSFSETTRVHHRYSLEDNSIASRPARPQSQLSTTEVPLLSQQGPTSPQPSTTNKFDQGLKPGKASVDRRGWVVLLYCLLHMVPLVIAIIVLCLNFLGVYWQDLDRPNQNAILQALQYAAKAHELMMAASLSAIVINQIQHNLSVSRGVPFGFLTAGFKFQEPSYIFTKEFFGGATAPIRPSGPSRFLPLGYLLLLGCALASVIGPSTAVAIIPRLSWWDVPREKAFGPTYDDRIYFNRTESELWPAEITNDIYATVSQCSASNTRNQDCAVRAMDIVLPWVTMHQNQGTKPNITVFQDFEVTRYLSSRGGPPDFSSWTVTSTVPSIFARDLIHYWDWLVENSTLPTDFTRPLLRPAFVDPKYKAKKPLVQAQCHTYLEPDWEHGDFEFPHDELLTPPLDKFQKVKWSLPNSFVLSLKGNDTSIGNPDDKTNPWMLFDWFDTSSTFSSSGAPSLGGVLIYAAFNGTDYLDALAACSFDGRWAPVEYYLDPNDVTAILQDTPNPMGILNGTRKANPNDLTQMNLTLEWANTMSGQGTSDDPAANVVEQILEGWGGTFMFPENRPTLGYNMSSLDWRISTTLGLYLTEGLARAFLDISKGSMLYRQTHDVDQSYVRYLNNINEPSAKEGYRDGRLDWVERSDPRWNSSMPTWDVWAPQNGYTEIKITVQRYGYGYGIEELPIKLAAAVLMIYTVFVFVYIVLTLIRGRIYRGYSDAAEMVALAWNSVPTEELKDTSTGIEDLKTWRQVVRVRERDDRQLQFVLGHD